MLKENQGFGKKIYKVDSDTIKNFWLNHLKYGKCNQPKYNIYNSIHNYVKS